MRKLCVEKIYEGLNDLKSTKTIVGEGATSEVNHESNQQPAQALWAPLVQSTGTLIASEESVGEGDRTSYSSFSCLYVSV